MRNGSRWSPVLSIVVATACAATTIPSPVAETPVASRHLLASDELRAVPWMTMDDVIRGLRPEWLRTRGRSAVGRAEEVQVLIDGVRVGGVEALRSVTVTSVTTVRFYDPISASSRWGMGFGNGAIVISTRGSR